MHRARNADMSPFKNNGPALPSSSTTDLPQIDPSDYEPDQIWKDEVTTRIDAAFESMLNDSKKTHGGRSKEEEMGDHKGLMKNGMGRSHLRFEEEWEQVIATIVALKKREFDHELAEERSSPRSDSPKLKPPVLEYITTSSHRNAKHNGPDNEPDDQWKAELMKKVDKVFASMVNETKEDMAAKLRKAHMTQDDRRRLEDEYKEDMAVIKYLKAEQYEFELNKERSKRLWESSGTLHGPAMTRTFKNEQASTMNSIRNTSSSGEGAKQSPTEERRPGTPVPVEAPPKPLQQIPPTVVPLPGFEDSPTLTNERREPSHPPINTSFHSTKTGSRSPKQRVTVEDVPDDESIQSYLPDDGPILELRKKGMDTQATVIERQRPTQPVRVASNHDSSPRAEPRVDTSKPQTAKRKVTEAEIRFGNRKVPELNNIYGLWTPPVPAGSSRVGDASPGKASQNRL